MSAFYLLFLLFNIINKLWVAGTIVSVVIGIMLAIYWSMTTDESICRSELKGDPELNTEKKLETAVQKMRDENHIKGWKRFKTCCIFFILFLITAIVFPSSKEAMIYMSLKTVDEYNVKHPDSSLNPDGALAIVDKTTKQVERVLRIIDKGGDFVEKKIEEQIDPGTKTKK